MKGMSLGAVIGGIVVFFWGFLFWGVLPMADGATETVRNQKALQSLLDAALPETGVYMLPFSDDPSDAEFQALHTAGPIATIYFRKEGSEPMAASTFVMGYLHEVVVLFLMALMLKLAGLQSYAARVGVVFLGGLAGSLFAQLSGPIWWLQPWGMAVMNVFYESMAWLLGGLILAAFVQPAGGRRDANEM